MAMPCLEVTHGLGLSACVGCSGVGDLAVFWIATAREAHVERKLEALAKGEQPAER